MSKKATATAPSSSAGRIPRRPTPHRLVVSLALVLFLPNLWLVAYGNLVVQTALVRFIGTLVVSWIAARLVFATMSSLPGSAAPAPALPGPVHDEDTGIGAADS